MTLGELERLIKSKKRIMKREAQERASFDYKLADLIGRSVARIYSSSTKLPDISEAYPTLFEEEQIEEAKSKKQDELSALRFKQFANSFNNRLKEAAKSSE